MDMPNIHELERHMIPPDAWSGYILSKFPKDVQDELVSKTSPMGIGHHNEIGWYCLGAGQGPFLIWAEKL